MNLTPASTFDSVYQLEKIDPVLGGAGNVANRQAQALLNRTEWLKDAIAALEGGGGPFDFDASAGVVPATGSGPAGAVARKDSYRVSVAGTVGGQNLQVGDQLVARQDAPTLISQYIILQSNVDLATATVLGLVKLAQDLAGGGAADKTLSTAGLIALFAQLASPAFTGNPTAPTQAALNSSTRLATTKYVDDAVAVETGARVTAVSGANAAVATEATNRINADNILSNAIVAFVDNLVAWTGPGGVSFSSGWGDGGNFGFKKTARGTVKMQGLCSSGGSENTGSLAFTLPAGYRPAFMKRLLVADIAGVLGPVTLDILPDGRVLPGQVGTSFGNPFAGQPGFYLDDVEFEV